MLKCTTKQVGADTGGHLAHDPGRIAGKSGGGGSRSSRLFFLTRTHHQRRHHERPYKCCKRRCGIFPGERNPQRKSCRCHGMSFVGSVMQPDRQWSWIYTRAQTVQQGLDQAPQAAQPDIGRRPVCTHTGPRERTQQPPPPTAHFALNHRAAVWSPFRTGGALRAPTEETKADRREDKDGDRAATAHGLLRNSRVNSAIPDFKVECDKIESKLRRLVLEYNDM